MKRDLDLYRRILLAVEQSDNNPADPIELDFVDDYAQGIVSYHVMLLDEEGLIKAARVLVVPSVPDPYAWFPKRLTAAGHNFLDAARNDETWTESKRLLKQAGGASLKVLWDLLVHLGKQKLGLPD